MGYNVLPGLQRCRTCFDSKYFTNFGNAHPNNGKNKMVDFCTCFSRLIHTLGWFFLIVTYDPNTKYTFGFSSIYSAIILFTVNKQINDKERVAAAMENPNLKEMVEKCITEDNL